VLIYDDTRQLQIWISGVAPCTSPVSGHGLWPGALITSALKFNGGVPTLINIKRISSLLSTSFLISFCDASPSRSRVFGPLVLVSKFRLAGRRHFVFSSRLMHACSFSCSRLVTCSRNDRILAFRSLFSVHEGVRRLITIEMHSTIARPRFFSYDFHFPPSTFKFYVRVECEDHITCICAKCNWEIAISEKSRTE